MKYYQKPYVKDFNKMNKMSEKDFRIDFILVYNFVSLTYIE